jgi:hypothetical protein
MGYAGTRLRSELEARRGFANVGLASVKRYDILSGSHSERAPSTLWFAVVRAGSVVAHLAGPFDSYLPVFRTAPALLNSKTVRQPLTRQPDFCSAGPV